MSADCTSKRVTTGTTLTITALVAIASGCADQAKQRADRIAAIVNADLPSANYLLFPDDIESFRAGRSKEDVLAAIRWRGNFEMAAQHRGRKVCVLSYEWLPEKAGSSAPETLFAIFVDGHFEKFVRWFRGEMEKVEYRGTRRSRPKPVKVGDLSWLVQALESEPVNFEELQKEIKAKPETPSRIDPGLTAVYLLLGGTKLSATEEDYKRNAELRDQFNAARLKLGNSEEEVEAVFNAKPIESGELEAGSYRIYGSNEAFNINPTLHFSNVLVVFEDEKAKLIYSVGAGDGWRQKLQERYVDLPPPKDMP